MWVKQVIATWRSLKDQQRIRRLYFNRCETYGMRLVTEVVIDKVELCRSIRFPKGHKSVATFNKWYQTRRVSSIDSYSASTIFEYEACKLTHSRCQSAIKIDPYFQLLIFNQGFECIKGPIEYIGLSILLLNRRQGVQ